MIDFFTNIFNLDLTLAPSFLCIQNAMTLNLHIATTTVIMNQEVQVNERSILEPASAAQKPSLSTMTLSF